MRSIITSILFFLSCAAAEPKLPELTIKNNSTQEITIHYSNDYALYLALKPLANGTIKLPLPQDITVHFNKLNYQQKVTINNTHEPLLIHHENSLSVMQNGIHLSPKVHFDAHRPSLTTHEES